MASKRRKRFLYLKASYQHTGSQTLEDYVRTAHQQLPRAKDRIVSFAEKTWQGTDYRDISGSFIVRYSVYTPGEQATTIPTGTEDAATVDLEAMPAAPNREFSDGDAIILVSGDALFSCTSQIQDRSIQPYLRALFKIAELEERALGLLITRPADIDKVNLIRNEGIKSIVMNASLGGADFARFENASTSGVLKKIWRGLSKEDIELARTAQQAEARFAISITGGKTSGDRNIHWLDAEAEEALGGSDSYKIITRKGKTITPTEIIISKHYNLASFGKTVFIEEAIRKLEAFKREFLGAP